MKHARPDYERFQDPAGLIPDDEPVFLIRGQDIIAADVLNFYADELDDKGGDVDMVEMVRKHATAMRLWRKHKMPDMPDGGK